MTFCVALALAAALTGQPSPSAPSGLQSESYVLENGLTVVLHDEPTVALVAVRVLYRLGSADDPPGRQGMVHLLEHSLFHGSEHIPGTAGNEFFRMSAIGQNGVTSPDYMQLFEMVPAGNLAAALRLEADRMGFYRFDSKRIGKEKLIVNREMVERASRSQWGAASLAVRGALFGESHPMHPATTTTVASVSVPELTALAEKAIAPNNAVLVLAGRLPDNTRGLVDKYFATLRRGSDLALRPREDSTLSREIRLSTSGGPDSAPLALIGWHAPHTDHPSHAAGSITASILRRRFLGRIAQRGRRPLGATGAFARFSAGRSYGVFLLGAIGEFGTAPESLATELDVTLAGLLETPPSTEEVVAARKRIAVSVSRQMDTLKMRAEVLAESAAEGGHDLVSAERADLERVTPEDVSRFVREYLGGARGRAVVLQAPKAVRR